MSIRNEGCGGFLAPPTHPTHTLSFVGSEYICCLENWKEYEWLPKGDREAAKRILTEWVKNKPSLYSTEVQEWIRKVLGYFRSCWKNLALPEPQCWQITHIRVGDRWEGQPLTDHCGVHHIMKYYPEYQALPEHFTQAYWGKKPE